MGLVLQRGGQAPGLVVDEAQLLLAAVAGAVVVKGRAHSQPGPITQRAAQPHVQLLPGVCQVRAVQAGRQGAAVTGTDIADRIGLHCPVTEGAGQPLAAGAGARDCPVEAPGVQLQASDALVAQRHTLKARRQRPVILVAQDGIVQALSANPQGTAGQAQAQRADSQAAPGGDGVAVAVHQYPVATVGHPAMAATQVDRAVQRGIDADAEHAPSVA
ncbi:hypothetical protein D3C79_785230 [compost metagenome]